MASITVAGLGSGIAYDSWITALVGVRQKDIDKVSTKITNINNQKSDVSTIESDYASLLTSIQKFTSALSTENVFNQKTATSSSKAITATADSTAKIQNLKISVGTLATATQASSASVAGSYIKNTTKVSEVSQGALTEGTFSVYVDGTKNSINITSAETMGDVVTALNGISGISASLSGDGKLTIGPSAGATVTVGSSSDTSNFKGAMALTASGINNTYTSSKSLFDTKTSAALVSGKFAGATAITAGTFTIGNAKFTIDGTTTLDGIISQINNNTDAGVTASWNAVTGKLVLKSNDEGASNINITAGDGTAGDMDASNFTDIMNLTTSTWDSGTGALQTTVLKTGSQALGTDATLTINDTTITSSSNTVTSDISGIAGLTLSLTDTTSSDATVSVAQDTSKVTDALNSFITAFNKAIADTDTVTTTDGTLHGESILTSLRNKIRMLATEGVTGSGNYKTLASIGITTGAIGTDVKANTNKLTLDTNALTAALKDNPDAVKKVLMGDSATATTGVFNDLETTIKNATSSVDGYFVKREASYTRQVSDLNKTKTKMTANLAVYQSQLEVKFSAMDTIISNLRNSASVFDSYFKSKSNSS